MGPTTHTYGVIKGPTGFRFAYIDAIDYERHV